MNITLADLADHMRKLATLSPRFPPQQSKSSVHHIVLRFSLASIALLNVAQNTDAQPNKFAAFTEVSRDRDCGVNCVVIACKLLGKNVDKRAIAVEAKLGPDGTNLADLATAISQEGLKCQGVNYSVADLRSWGGLAIAHFQDHFVLVQGFVRSGDMRIIDAPNLPFDMSVREFSEKWDGKALLISTGQFATLGAFIPASAFLTIALAAFVIIVAKSLFYLKSLRTPQPMVSPFQQSELRAERHPDTA